MIFWLDSHLHTYHYTASHFLIWLIFNCFAIVVIVAVALSRLGGEKRRVCPIFYPSPTTVSLEQAFIAASIVFVESSYVNCSTRPKMKFQNVFLKSLFPRVHSILLCFCSRARDVDLGTNLAQFSRFWGKFPCEKLKHFASEVE